MPQRVADESWLVHARVRRNGWAVLVGWSGQGAGASRRYTWRTVATGMTEHDAREHADEVRCAPWRHYEAAAARHRPAPPPVEPQPLPAPSHSGIPERLEDGWWLLPCGLHESRRLHLHCATCERAAAELAERLEDVARGAAVAEARRTHRSEAA